MIHSLRTGLQIGVSDFFHWWLGELRGIILPQLQVKLRSHRPPEIFCSGKEFSVAHTKANGKQATVSAFPDWPKAARAIKRARRGSSSAKLVIDEGFCFVRTTSIPSVAQGKAGDILILEIERLTPFQRADICFGWRALPTLPGETQTQFIQAIVKRAVISAMIADLFASGFERVSVACRLSDNTEVPIRLPQELARNNSPMIRAVRIANWLVACAVGAGILAAGWMAFAAQRQALQRLDADIAAAQSRAFAVRTKYDEAFSAARKVLALRDRKNTTPTVAEVIDEVTRVLPDTAWVTDLQIDREKIGIAGFAQSAAPLIGLLDQSELFGDVQLASPVVRAPRENADRYNISLKATSSDARQ